MRLGHSLRSREGGIFTWGIIFAVIAAFYMATFSFRRISDTDVNSYQTRALALHGDVNLVRYGDNVPRHSYTFRREGIRYSIYGVGVSISALPIYAVAARLGASDKALQAAAAIPFVAAGVVIMLRLLLRLFPRGIAIGSTIVYAFGTTMWPLASMAFFQHGPASLYQAIGLTGLFSQRRGAPFLAGFGFAAATFVRPTLIIPLVIIGVLYLIEDRRGALLYAAATLPMFAGVLIQNRWIWGSWLSGGYSEAGVGFHGDMPRALWGLLVGWYRGIFAYSPVLAVGVIGAVMAFRRIHGPVERRMVALAVSSVALIFFYARWSTWFGGQNMFGYRYLLDIVPFMVILMAYGVTRSDRLKTIAIPFGVLSVLTMAFGAASSQNGFDGPLFPKGIVRTSLGQAWLVFVNYPVWSLVRLVGIGAIGALIYYVAPRLQETSSEERVAPPALAGPV